MKKNKTLKRFLAFVLCAAMLVTYMPSAAFSFADDGSDVTAVEETTAAPTQEAKAEKPAPAASEPAQAEEPAPASEPEPAAEAEPAEEAAPADETADQPAEEATEPESGEEAAPAEEPVEEVTEAPEEEKAKEETKLNTEAKTFVGKANSVNVKVVAPAGTFPEGTTMKVTSVAKSEVRDAVEGAFADEVNDFRAVDITFYADGKEVHPEKEVSVKLTTSAFETSEDLNVVHIEDSGDASVMDLTKASDTAAQFKTDGFSVYVVVETGADARLNVKFMNGDTEIAHTIVKQSDIDSGIFDQIVYDPGVGTLGDGEVFRGWTTKENYTQADINSGMTIDGVRDAVKAKLNAGVTETGGEPEDMYIYAMVFKAINVTYKDEDSVVIRNEAILTARGESGEITYEVNEPYVPKTSDQEFQGWYFTSSAAVKDASGSTIPAGSTIENESTVKITADLILSVKAPKGAWLIFKENAKGASYTSPQFLENEKPTKPSDPTRRGYVFGGWYTNEECTGEQFNFDQVLTETTRVYAKWTEAETASYTVIIWRQKATDAKDAADSAKTYDFAESVTLTGNVGTNINTVTSTGSGNNRYASVNGTEKRYDGFHLGRFDQNVPIKSDGTSVLNVYYDRNLVTLTFMAPGNWGGWTTQETMTGLYGSTLSSNGYTWPTNYWWRDTQQQGGTRTTFLDAFKLADGGDSETFYGYNGSGSKNIRWYKQSADGTWPALNSPTNSATGSGDFNISDKYNGYHVVSYSTNGTTWTTVSGKNAQGYYATVSNNSYQNLYIRCAPDLYNIQFTDGVYVNGEGVAVDGYSSRGELKVEKDIPYESDISSYNKGNAKYYEPTFEGFVFEGWYLDDTCTQPCTFTNMPEGLQVFAKWVQKQYRVFLHPNVPTSDTSFSMGDQNTCFRINYGESLDPIDARRDDYELVGWYTDEACTHPFNFDAYVMNDTTVTTPYDQTESTELDKYGNPTQNINKDKQENRFWITTKLNLYAKWRSKLLGANGITVVYDAVDGEGTFDGGKTTYTDPLTYKDQAKAVAAGASKATDAKKEFDCWAIQKWNGSAFVDTGDTVLPGDSFEVLKSYTQQTENEGSTEEDPSYTYTFKLVAQYKPIEEETLTHITWYANNGTDAKKNDDNLKMNQAINIEPANTFSYDGFEFLGWARWEEGSKPASPTDTTNLWLYYKDGKFYQDAGFTKEAKQVACDEKTPYHDLYAVWKEYPKATFEASKKLEGRAWKSTDSFTFTLTAQNGAPMPKEGTTATFTADGKKSFGEIHFPEAATNKTYTYTISETSTLPKNVTKSADITVTVTFEVKDGELVPKVEYTNEGTITNTYKPDKLVVDPTKTVFGEKNVTAGTDAENGKDFNFTLSAVTTGAPMPKDASAKVHYDKAQTGKQTIPFGTIEYETAGTYTYTITEADPGDGWTAKNEGKGTVTVKITDDGEGKLTASVTPATIENSYKAEEITVDPSDTKTTFGEKNVTVGTDAKDGKTFNFTLAAVTENAPMPKPATASVSYAAGEKGPKVIPFGEITYEKAGKYTYTITEAAAGDGWTTDGNPATVVVTITDNGDGTLSASVAKATITNEYSVEEIVVNPQDTKTTFGEKNVTAGTDAEDGKTFNFTIAAVTKDAPLPEDKTVSVSYDAGEDGVKTIPFGNITYTAAGEYKYTITEAAAGEGWTTKGSPAEVTVTITDNGDGTLSASVAKATINNTYAVEEIEVDPTAADTTFGKKDVTATTEDGKGHDFSFTLEAVTKDAPMPTAEGGASASVSYAAKETGKKTIPFGKITYTKAGEYEYKITEADPGKGWTVSNNGAKVIVKITDNGDGTLSAAVENTPEIVNAYGVSVIEVDPTNAETTFGKKNVTATTADGKAKTFNFTLTAANGTPMPTAEGGASASVEYAAGATGEKTIPFGKIKYNKAGTYTYTITEADPGKGWTATGNPATVTVTISDNGDGSLSAEVSTATISNAYSVSEIEVDPTAAETTFGKKDVTAGTDAEDGKTFNFTLSAVTTGAPMPTPATAELSYAAGETGAKTIPFGKIKYAAAGVYKYKITETAPGDGWTVTGNEPEVTVTVTDNGDGTLSAAVTSATDIKNAYKAENIVVDPKDAKTTFGKKNVTAGTDAKDGKKFNFTLSAVTTGAPMPTPATAELSYAAGETGAKTIPFGAIAYSKAGVYKYKITETAPGDGWTVTGNGAEVTVTVTDNGDGTLSAAVATADPIANAYKAEEIEVDPTAAETTFGKKNVTAAAEDGKAKTFNFTLSAAEGTPMPKAESAKVEYAAGATGAKTIPFGKIKYDKAGTYTYTITEAAAGDGWTTTGNNAKVTVTVTDNGDGTLSAAIDKTAEISNAYAVEEITVDPTDAEAKTEFGKKNVTATTADGKAHEFSFTLKADKEGDPMPESATAKVNYAKDETGSKTIPFGTITYTKAGKYTYTITEAAVGDGWTTTGNEAKVTVTITDNGDGTLSAAIDKTVEISNKYAAEPIVVDPTDAEAKTQFGKKNVTTAAADGKAKTFNFTLAAVTEKAPMPKDAKVSVEYAAGATGEKVLPFGEITYTAAGEYKYTITEAAAGDGWTTTGSPATVTVTITDNGDGTLSAKIDKTVEIENKYAVEDITVDPTDAKTTFGKKNVTETTEDGKAKTFNFTLEAVTKDAPMPKDAKASLEYAAGATGAKTIPFGEITYSAAGEYEYKITEADPGKGWTVSNNGASVIVKITDNGDGTLSAAVEKTPEIRNGYKVDEITVDPTNDKTTFGKKNVTATTADGKGHEFNFTLEAVTEGAPMPKSAKASVSYDAAETGVKKIPFGEITYTKAGDYTYKITEADPGKGWTATGNGAEVTVSVTDNGDGTMSAEVKTTPEIKNKYAVEEIKVDPKDAKTTFGKKDVKATTEDGKGHEFSFTLAKDGDAPMPASAEAKVSYEAAETGVKTIPFGEITYAAAGEYKYTITEADPGKGWTPTGNGATVTIKIKDNGDGTLSVESVDTKTIENKYAVEELIVDPTDAEAKTEFGKKNVTATTEDGKGKTFNFTLAKKGDAPMPTSEEASVSYEAGKTGEQTIPFGKITYTKPGEYKYTITEAAAGGGWTTEGNKAEVVVTVKDNGDGTMSAVAETQTITNSYAVKPLEVDPTDAEAGTEFGKKNVTATTADGKGKTFNFTLAKDGEAPMPESAEASVSYKAGETGEQTIPFGKITYTKPGEYKYTITEAEAGKGWTTTGNDAEVTVTVVDNGDGTMTASVAETAVVENSYKAEPVVVDDKDEEDNPIVKKIVEGEGFDATEFKFSIAAETAGAPLPEPAEGTVTAEEAGEFVVDFGAITFEKVGTYVYTIKETTEAPSRDWTCDNTEKTVRVVVTDDGEGQLHAKVEGVEVTNTYVELVDIIYHLNGGNWHGDPSDIVETYPVDTWIKIHAKPVREGYRFVEWRGSSYQPGDDYHVMAHHEFVAIWEKEAEPEEPEKSDKPDTGDHNDPLGALAGFILAGAGLGGVYAYRRRKEEE